MRDIIIVGAGGFGREVMEWINDINEVAPAWRIKGFVADDRDTALVGLECDYRVIGTTYDYTPEPGDFFICAIGSPAGRRAVAERMKKRGASFVGLIHPKAVISDSARIGEAFIAYPYSVVGADVEIGDFVNLLSSSIGHGARLGDFVSVSSYCHVSSGARLGSGTELGSHACVLDGVTLGANVFLGAGAFAAEDFPGNVRLWGNPAKVIGPN